MKGAKIRLYVDQPLGQGQSVPLSRDQAHYLFGVMRLSAGDAVLLFNGQAGEWRAEIVEAGKRGGMVKCTEQTAPQRFPPDLWLLFAPIKKARTDFIVEKAAELGAARICPVQTEFTNAERIRRDRLQAHAVEAAEQCGGTYVPEVNNIRKLTDILKDWPEDRNLIFCDEALADATAASFPESIGSEAAPRKAAILIGPEGGFSETERHRLRHMATTISLGPRILRADTAAVAALTLWQSQFGDWI
ncbi:MAG: 16S rRNA (uracil(1498)-N(3))-methyltransferase [Pseudomonadota bacterium]